MLLLVVHIMGRLIDPVREAVGTPHLLAEHLGSEDGPALRAIPASDVGIATV
jgi:hypothetical protein